MRLLRPSALPTLRAAPRPRSKACARVVLHRPKTTRYTATMEPGAASQEQADFNNVAVTRYAAAGHNGSAAVARLGLGSGQQTGPAKTLQVAKGDTITFTAYAWLTAAVAAASNSTSPKNPPLVLPAPQPNTAPPAAPGADGAPTKRSGLPTVGISVALPIGGPDDAAPQGGGAPGIARLHYRVLDAQGTVLLDDYQTANGATPATWQTLQVGLRLQQAGSVQLSVETNGAAGPTVYFDDVAVEQTGGLIVQEQHQYAFGAPLPGLSYTVGSTRYRHGYQGQFADKDEETGFDSFELRLYNSRIGRWTAPDPYGQFDSPYVGMGNNPVMGTDPDGGFFGPGPFYTLGNITTHSFMLGEAVVVGSKISVGASIGLNAAKYATTYFNYVNGAANMAVDKTLETASYAAGFTPFSSRNSWQETKQGLSNVNPFTETGRSNLYQAGQDGGKTLIDFLDPGSEMTAEQRGGIVGGIGYDVLLTKGVGAGASSAGRFVSATLRGEAVLGSGVGPLRQWLRTGKSFSQTGQFKTKFSIKWGAAGDKYLNKIGSPKMQQMNKSFRNMKLPGKSWRTIDPGHFHLKK